MPVIIESEGTKVTARLKGEIDHHNAGEIRRDIDLAADMHRPDTLILDFNDVTFMDSSGIGLVMGRYKIMRACGGKLIVTNTPAQIKKVMKLAGLDGLASIE